MNLCDPRDIQALLSAHGFRFSKAMGQNFLIDPQIPIEIAAASGADAGTGVLEIGPGIGPLTAALAARAGKVVAVELDHRLLPVLEETMAHCPNVEIVPGDIMKLPLPALVARLGGLTPAVCANLPYNITTPVLTRLLDSHLFSKLTVMIQREVALRICAAPGTSDYGAFSLYCQYHADCQLLFEVPAGSFLPAPKVVSAVLCLVPRAKPAEVTNEALFFQVVRASFAQRRKTLLNGLSSAFGSRISKDALRAAIAACALREDVRGETLGIHEFATLAAVLEGVMQPRA